MGRVTFFKEFFSHRIDPKHILLRIGLISLIASIIVSHSPKLFSLLAVNPVDFHFWQPFTAIFIYPHPVSLVYAFISLWMFGCHVEANLGEKRCLGYFLLCGISANIFWLIYVTLFHGDAPIFGYGLEGVIFGMIYGYAYFRPDRSVTISGVIDIPSRVYAGFYGLVALLLIITPPYGAPYAFMEIFGGLAGAIYLDILHLGPLTRYMRKLAK